MIINNFISLTIIISIFISGILAETLMGTVKYDGNPMPKKASTQLKMNADPVCGSSHKDPVYRQSLIVNDNATLKNVLVYLVNVKYDGEADTTQAVIDQNGCMYSPHVQGIMAGQELLIKNSDATMHNIHGLPKINPEFNFSMPKVVKEKAIKIEKVENFIKIKCDVHPWMNAYISVFDHPFFAVTDDTGSFKIDSIPPGTYEVIAWQEKFKDKKTKEWNTLNASVTIGEGDTTHNFTFIREAKKK